MVRMSVPDAERIGLTRASDADAEWWVTLDGKRVVGFGGHDAQQRAERYAQDLLRIAERHTAQRCADSM
jgi:hypothetical protein